MSREAGEGGGGGDVQEKQEPHTKDVGKYKTCLQTQNALKINIKVRCWGAQGPKCFKNQYKTGRLGTGPADYPPISGVRVYIFYVTILYVIFYVIFN